VASSVFHSSKIFIVKILKYHLKYYENAIIVIFTNYFETELLSVSSEFYKPAKGAAVGYRIPGLVAELFH
jgi:hypothetical protein